jgi:hypothetical protein
MTDAVVADAASGWPVTRTPGRSAARLAVRDTRLVILEETLTGFDQDEPGPRRIRALDRSGPGEAIWEPAPPVRIADAVVHDSGAISLALVDEHRRITLVRLDARLEVIAMTPLVDPAVATDPPVDPDGPSELMASGFTAESVRIGAIGPTGDDALVAVFTSRYSVVAYRVSVGDAGFAIGWRQLIEPPVGLTPFLPIGGSYDTFGAITVWFRPSLAVDRAGNAYLAVWGGGARIRIHNLVFGEALAPLFTGPGENDSDVLLSKIDPAGARQWTRVVGARHEDEPYALAAADNEVVVVGRSRRNPGNDNRQWDPWLAALDGSGRLLASRTFGFDALGIALAAAVDDAGRIVAGGSDGWAQNPDGLSILAPGAKLLFTLRDAAAEPVRIALAPGPRHNEIRSVALTGDAIWFGGHEDGPLTHSGDSDPGEIHATGVMGALPR